MELNWAFFQTASVNEIRKRRENKLPGIISRGCGGWEDILEEVENGLDRIRGASRKGFGFLRTRTIESLEGKIRATTRI